MIETVLVTGGTGFIGRHVIELLIKNQYKVIVLKRSFSNTWRIKEFENQIVSYDLDKVELQEIFQRESVDKIVHLATYYRKNHSPEDVEPMIVSNILFPVKLLENAKEFGVKSFINTGTFFEYSHDSLPIVEDSNEKPFNFYARTKIAFENILESYCNDYGIKSITLKLFSPYGPYDNEQKIIPLLINHAIKDEEISLTHGLQKLDFVYVKDIAEAYIDALENISKLDKYEAINIGNGFPYSIRDIVSLLEEIIGKPIKKHWNENFDDNMDVIYPDIKKSNKILNWKPKYTLKRGLEETLNYYRGKNDI
jgi:nucleoside-diphosphate-sugar epimerase